MLAKEAMQEKQAAIKASESQLQAESEAVRALETKLKEFKSSMTVEQLRTEIASLSRRVRVLNDSASFSLSMTFFLWQSEELTKRLAPLREGSVLISEAERTEVEKVGTCAACAESLGHSQRTPCYLFTAEPLSSTRVLEEAKK